MPDPDKEFEAALGGDPDKEFEDMLGASPAPRSHVTELEPVKIEGSVPAQPRDWWQTLLDKSLGARGDQTAARGVTAPLKTPEPLTSEQEAKLAQDWSALERTGFMRKRPDGSIEVLPDPVRAIGAMGLNFAGNAAMAAAPALGGGLRASAPALAQLAAGGAMQGAGAGLATGVEPVSKDMAQDVAVGAGVGAAVPVAGAALGAGANSLMKGANKLRTQIFMTPAQRAAYTLAKGPDALAQLGADAREAGLFKGGLGPTTARRVAENADRVMAESGAGIGRFEDDLVSRGVAPEVETAPIAADLRAQAGKLRRVIDPNNLSSTTSDASVMSRMADMVDQPETVSMVGRKIVPPELPRAAMPTKQETLQFPAAVPPAGVSLPEVPDLQLALPGAEVAPRQLELPLTRPPQTQLQFGGMSVPPSAPVAQGELADRTLGSVVRFTPGGPVRAADAQWAAATRAVPGVPRPEPSQLSFPEQQLEMFERARPDDGRITQWIPGELSGEQLSLGLTNPNREPPPAQSYDLPPTEATLTRDTIPFEDAAESKRYIANRIKWNKNANQDDFGAEAARKATWSQLSAQMDRALEGAAARGEIDPAQLAEYRENMKRYSTAATTYDPALRMAEKQGQVGVGVGDLLAASAVGGGPGGAATAVASRASRGRGAAMGAGITEAASGALQAGSDLAGSPVGRGAAITAAARAKPDAPKSEIERDANNLTKRSLGEWWRVLTGK